MPIPGNAIKMEVTETAMQTVDGQKHACTVRPNPEKCPHSVTSSIIGIRR